MTNSKTNGVGPATSRKSSPPAGSWPTSEEAEGTRGGWQGGRAIALLYNWWHLYARLYDGEHHREVITSRPALLNGVARLTAHSGQRTVKVSLPREKGDRIAEAITAVSNTLQRLNAIAERWTSEQRLTLLLTPIFRRWLGGKWLGELPLQAALFLSG